MRTCTKEAGTSGGRRKVRNAKPANENCCLRATQLTLRARARARFPGAQREAARLSVRVSRSSERPARPSVCLAGRAPRQPGPRIIGRHSFGCPTAGGAPVEFITGKTTTDLAECQQSAQPAVRVPRSLARSLAKRPPALSLDGLPSPALASRDSPRAERASFCQSAAKQH